MRLPGVKGQIGTRDLSFRADSLIASATAPQLVLPEQWQRCHLKFQNTSTAIMYLEFGSARAHAVLTNGAVTSIVMDNEGFGFTRAPRVEFLGGAPTNSAGVGALDPFSPSPSFPAPYRQAKGQANLAGGKVTSITINDPGAGYSVAPYVRLTNDQLDFIGCADPSVNSGSGCIIYPGQWFTDEHLVVPSEQIAVFCATLDATFFCRYL